MPSVKGQDVASGFNPGGPTIPYGVWGDSGSAHDPTDPIAGMDGVGVLGSSAHGAGVFGVNENPGGIGVLGQADHTTGTAVSGTSAQGTGVSGLSNGSNPGVTGTSTQGTGVSGLSNGSNPGVFGTSNLGAGVSGTSLKGPGLSGTSTDGIGVTASSTSGTAALFASRQSIQARLATSLLAGDFLGNVNISDSLTVGAKLGVGTTSPRNPVGIRGAGVAEELLSFEDGAGATRWHVNQKLGGRSGLNFVETGVADGVLYLAAGGNVGVGTTTPAFELHVNGTSCATQFCNPSDVRLKCDITPVSDVLTRLAGVRAVSFRSAADQGQPAPPQLGVIAQEVEHGFPELIVSMGPEGFKAVDYGGLTGVLVEAVKELTARNAELSARLATIEQAYGRVCAPGPTDAR